MRRISITTVGNFLNQHWSIFSNYNAFWSTIDAQFAEIVCIWCIRFIDKNLVPMSSRMSEWASEQTNERSWAREQCRSMQMSERCKRRSEWLSTLRADFIVFLPNVRQFSISWWPFLDVPKRSRFWLMLCHLHYAFSKTRFMHSPVSVRHCGKGKRHDSCF